MLGWFHTTRVRVLPLPDPIEVFVWGVSPWYSVQIAPGPFRLLGGQRLSLPLNDGVDPRDSLEGAVYQLHNGLATDVVFDEFQEGVVQYRTYYDNCIYNSLSLK